MADSIRRVQPAGYGADQMRIDGEHTAKGRPKPKEKKPDKPFNKVLLDKEHDILNAEEEKKRKLRNLKRPLK